ncbi:uncharacterized protein LOC119403209 [Rhipicephalus sanguineus]|uniref:uncharacterized protein LOC119403209 n=1 Tax=Rhipicephalus sanguineus TaxID=34632 RepID=UPI001893D0A3|nr:uncharacterized protein LOC119403209 [Rhipicephalus sanguineus]
MLPLGDRPLQPDASLATPIRRAIREQLAESVPDPAMLTQPMLPQPCPSQVTQPCLPVAAPLTYAAVAARPPPPTFAFSEAMYPRTAQLPAPPPMPTRSQYAQNPWRTRDNRPICFACGFAGHVARFCNCRMSPAHQAAATPGYGYPYATGDQATRLSSDFSPPPRRPFSTHRSPSPRRRSPSPLRSRQPPSEGN